MPSQREPDISDAPSDLGQSDSSIIIAPMPTPRNRDTSDAQSDSGFDRSDVQSDRGQNDSIITTIAPFTSQSRTQELGKARLRYSRTRVAKVYKKCRKRRIPLPSLTLSSEESVLNDLSLEHIAYFGTKPTPRLPNLPNTTTNKRLMPIQHLPRSGNFAIEFPSVSMRLQSYVEHQMKSTSSSGKKR